MAGGVRNRPVAHRPAWHSGGDHHGGGRRGGGRHGGGHRRAEGRPSGVRHGAGHWDAGLHGAGRWDADLHDEDRSGADLRGEGRWDAGHPAGNWWDAGSRASGNRVVRHRPTCRHRHSWRGLQSVGLRHPGRKSETVHRPGQPNEIRRPGGETMGRRVRERDHDQRGGETSRRDDWYGEVSLSGPYRPRLRRCTDFESLAATDLWAIACPWRCAGTSK